MRRNTTFARGTHVPSATPNAMQDEQCGLIPATDAPATLLKGADVRWWTTPDAGVADGTLRVVDTSIDWKSRRLLGVFRNLGAAARRPGQTDDHVGNDPSLAVGTRSFDGWTGTGGVGAAAATVADGVPPVLADGAFAVVVDEGATSADRVYLYARPSDGALCIYNDSGATLHADLVVAGSGVAPTPGAPPPDVIPALTEVQWLTPGLAAARPADPGGPAIYRATDTGAITLYDGGAWRDLTTAAPPTRIPLLAGLVSTVLGADTVVGRGYVDPTGLTSLTLEAIGDVVSGVTGTLDLYDLTALAVVATLAWTETAATRKTASVTVPGTARLYELRVRKSGGAGADYALFSGVSLIGS